MGKGKYNLPFSFSTEPLLFPVQLIFQNQHIKTYIYFKKSIYKSQKIITKIGNSIIFDNFSIPIRS